MKKTPSKKRQTQRMQAASTSRTSAERVDAVDAARGFAVAMMIAYHFCFDLTYYHWADWQLLVDPRWIAWRSAIVTSFLFVVGVSLALRDARERQDARGEGALRAWLDRAFVRRWLQLAFAAALVSAGSAALFPQSFIYFGVLHFVAVAVLLCRRAPRLGGWSAVLGAAVLAVGLGWSDPAFDPRVVDWIGFATEKPQTEDFVPLFPWLGVVLIGCGAGASWVRRGCRVASPLRVVGDAMPRTPSLVVATMGRWSLTIYLVHQPLMLGALGLVAQAR